MPLEEYLYVDAKRLDSYFEQVSSEQFKHEKKPPAWGVEFGLTGPKAGGSQDVVARPFTQHEKVLSLLSHLKDGGLMSDGGRFDPARFRLETHTGLRMTMPIHLPPAPARGGTAALWLCLREGVKTGPNPRRLGPLFLLEDDALRDGASIRPPTSLFSAFVMLRGYVSAMQASVYDIPESDVLERQDRDLCLRPLHLLESMGATASTTRRIQTLYRVREESSHFPQSEDERLVTFGYPVFIREAQ